MDKINFIGDQNLWTILITYSFVQGLVLFAYILSLRPLQKNLLFLGILVLCTSIVLLNFLYEYFGWYFTYPELLWVSSPLWYLFGPLLLLVTLFSIDSSRKFKWYEFFHLLPFFIWLIRMWPVFGSAGESKVEYYMNMYNPQNFEPNLFNYIYLLHFSVYTIGCYLMLKKHTARIKAQYADSNIIGYRELLHLLGIYGLYLLLDFVVALGLDYSYSGFIEFDYLSLIIFSTSIHLLVYYLVLRNRYLFSQTLKPIKSDSSIHLNEEEAKRISIRLINYLGNEKPYLNPDLRLGDLSKQLNVPLYQLSYVINNILSKNFFDLINEYRVLEVKKRLRDPKFGKFTILAVAYEFGFNSNTSFYRVFKKFTGMTPKQFIDQSKRHTLDANNPGKSILKRPKADNSI